MFKNIIFISICSVLVSAILFSCKKNEDRSPIPEISFIGLSKDTLQQSPLNLDSLKLRFSFVDGDGDIGSNDSLNIFLRDNRDNFLANQYKIPELPIHGKNGLEGVVTIDLFTTCCIFPDNTPPCTNSEEHPFDELTYDIWIEDRSGNVSNVITTSPIILKCNRN